MTQRPSPKPSNAADYGPVFHQLLAAERLAPLAPGTPNPRHALLDNLDVVSAFVAQTVVNPAAANACIAGVLLYHDRLDESHAISQTLTTPEGSYWHGLMHRREPDFDNSRYWFRRVGRHPVFAALAQAVRPLALEIPDDPYAAFLSANHWDPMAMIDWCQACHEGRSSQELLCRQVQHAEWWLLFDYYYAKAVTPEP